MYQAERERIEKAGGRIRRVVLDYELKQKAYSPLAKAKALPPLDYARRQEQIARENGLKVVQGHITLPDLRIEYETAEASNLASIWSSQPNIITDRIWPRKQKPDSKCTRPDRAPAA